MYFALDLLPRLVIRLVQFQVDLELGQDIFLDFHGRVAGGIAHLASDRVRTFDDFRRQRTITGCNAEPARRLLAFEDHILLGVGDREDSALAGHRLEINLP